VTQRADTVVQLLLQIVDQLHQRRAIGVVRLAPVQVGQLLRLIVREPFIVSPQHGKYFFFFYSRFYKHPK
jgi:hypothetical protein